ncbi:SAM-dependent methyltransferase [Myxococcus stipitatus DSM 14675]|uniref:SAM-dependent methyltransferase n=1 Tax=Myxococcus stipitatus (strain DSM 14675 / JCM 12634 / Mx s8) TaxID=1278073 RepID=L7ULN5_MYXSD|nr:class I SAM-dependent methyltransferase [Myxococcus stipitatus]AGC48825.1 SAM-dependent methyltransferase [Myxococcus stipitatus DSM 14675]
MSSTASPLAAPEPWDLVAPEYVRELLPMFETFARDALSRTGVAAGQRVVDVAAGPGTLSLLAARQGVHVTAVDFSPQMMAFLRERAAAAGLSIDARIGDGMALELPERTFDAAYSLFGLMFFPDRPRGFRELYRVLRPGGRAVVSSWQPMQSSPSINAFFQSLAEIMGGGGGPRDGKMPLSDPETCEQEMSDAGFTQVAVHQVSASVTYPSAEEMVEAMARSSAPIALMAKGMGDQWPPLQQALREKVRALLGDGPQSVLFQAYLTTGVRPASTP